MNLTKFISIYFPTRGRLDLLEKLMFSLENTTQNKKWIEVIAICDHDDVDTLCKLSELSSKITFDFYFISRKQNSVLNLPVDYYSLALKLKSDSYFTWGVGNDVELLVDGWDMLLYTSLLETFPNILNDIESTDKYYYIRINDGTHWNDDGNINVHGDKSCCFPILSSNYVNNAGEFMPMEFPIWGADTALYNFVINSKKFQVVDASLIVKIAHYCVHNNSYYKDDIAYRVEQQDGVWKSENKIDREFTKKFFKKRTSLY